MHKRSATLAAIALLLATRLACAQSLDVLAHSCAPTVHPTTLEALVRAESGNNPYALSDDGVAGRPWSERKSTIHSYSPSSASEAEAIAVGLIARGHIVDLGLMQVSSANLGRYGLSVRQALDPCTNIATGAQILTRFYGHAIGEYANTDSALLAAISAYNTGNFRDGFSNGYVDRVLRAGSDAPLASRTKTVSVGRQYPRSQDGSTALLSSKFAILSVVSQ